LQRAFKECKTSASNVRKLEETLGLQKKRLAEIPVEAEHLLDKFFFADRIHQRLIRDLKRSR
jgi:hypothetical protein